MSGGRFTKQKPEKVYYIQMTNSGWYKGPFVNPPVGCDDVMVFSLTYEGMLKDLKPSKKEKKEPIKKGKKCTKCKKGTYIETSLMDDIAGVLHCSECGHLMDNR